MTYGPALVHAKGLRLALGGDPMFDSVDLVLRRGERAALVGANGAGKSTLMRIIAGALEADGGDIAFASGTVLGWAEQETRFEGFVTLRDFVCAPSSNRAASAGPAPAYAAEALLESFDLDPDRAPVDLSGGQQRRASLARALAVDPDILLLDEPTNHLDIAAILALEKRLNTFKGACFIISHDRRFLENVSNSTMWLRQRRIIRLDRGFAAFDQWAEAVELEEARALARLETHLAAEEHWLQRGVTARRSRNEGRRRKLQALRAESRERKTLAATQKAAIQAERGAESARLVIEAEKLTKRYGGQSVISNVSLRLMRGDRLGVVGHNGAGKTTLLELFLKRRDPDEGSVRLGEGLQIAYIDQTRMILDRQQTIWEALAPMGGDQVMVRGKPRHVAAYAGDFLFRPEQLRQPLKALSGGERNRLALAVALARPSNLLVLDEPTNDLDMDTLDALEEMLADYDGTVILVSHDRAFLDGVATQIVGPIGGGRWAESPGGWSDFEREHSALPAKPRAAKTSGVAPAMVPGRPAKKLGYKQARRLAEIESLLPALAAEIEDIQRRLADQSGFALDPAAFQAAVRRLEAAQTHKEAVEAEWFALELEREALRTND